MNSQNKNEKPLYCVIILHYITTDETVNCVESILKIKSDTRVKIVIVDNASPNGSGETLSNKYENDDDIVVIRLNDNIGFAKANNIGYLYSVKNYSPDYIIILNNDIEFCQQGFFEEIEQLYIDYHFSILGPDIINISNNTHQNPIRTSGVTIREIKKSLLLRRYIIAVNKNNPFAVFSYSVIKKLKKHSAPKTVNVANEFNRHEVLYKNPVLYGACVIYSSEYIQRHRLAFCPQTFMYFEEDFLWYMLKNRNELILYSPSLVIKHKHNGATAQAHTDEKERVIFKEKCAIESGRLLIEYISNGCKEFDEVSTEQFDINNAVVN